MDLRTNYRQDYATPELSSKQSTPHGNKEIVTEQKVYVRRPMNEISQTRFDFRPYLKHRPSPAADMEPFLSQITIGNSFLPVEKFVFNNRILLSKLLYFSRESQYRLDYPGHDTNQHPRQPVAAPKDYRKPYIPPIHKMDILTTTQVILL
jgi:hypothetical protein